MASIQEIMLQLEGQKSPFISLLEGFAGGISKSQDKSLENAKVLISMDQERRKAAQEMAAQQRLQQEDQLARAVEQGTQNDIKTVGLQGTPPGPAQRLKVAVEVDPATGYRRRKVETVETPPAVPKTLDQVIADKVNSKELTLEQAYAIKNKHEGMTPSLQYQMTKDQEKKAEDKKNRSIPGYEETGEVVVLEPEAQKLRQSVAEFESFREGLQKYRELIQTYGTAEPTDRRVAAQMAAYAKQLQLTVKNIAQLGVLSSSDIPYIEEPVPPPGIFKTAKGMLGALDSSEAYMKSKVDQKLKTSGYRKAGGAAVAGAVAGDMSLPKVGDTFQGGKVISITRID